MTKDDLEAEAHGALLQAVESRTAGDRIIRGGTLRSAGYVFSTALTAVAYAFLLRHLGKADFGRYATVVALVAIATGVTEAGLTTIGQRLYAQAATAQERRRVLADLVGIRLVLTPLGVVLAALFGAVASYGTTMVVGVLVAGAGGVLINAATTVAMPLTVSLRLGLVTLIEVGRQVALVVAILALVAAGAGLGPFFWAYAASGIVMAVLVVALVDRRSLVPPRVSLTAWRPILQETAPLAVAVAINTFYLRLLIVLASLLIADDEVGRFATASRVTEVLAALPAFMIGGAFPLLAHAGAHDEPRLAYALQRIAEVSLLVGTLFVLVLEIGAEPVIRVFAGPEFTDVVPVLRVQAVALLGASMTQVWVLAAVAVGAQRALLWVNGVALAAVAVLGSALIPTLEAGGAALAAATGELVLATAALVALVRARPALRPDFTYVPRVAVSAAAGLALLLSPLPAAIDAILGAGVFLAVAWMVGAVPVEVVQAFRRRGESAA